MAIVKSCFSEEAEEEIELRDTDEENEGEDFYADDTEKVNSHLNISHQLNKLNWDHQITYTGGKRIRRYSCLN
jgi:hypothetical protein